MKWLSYRVVVGIAALVQTCALAAVTNALPESRILQFDDYALTNNGTPPTWTHVGSKPVGLVKQALNAGTNHFHRAGWSLLSCRTGTASGLGREVAPDSLTNLAANLQNTLGAQIESPVYTNGIGTVYFEAINNVEDTQITVEFTTNMTSWVSVTNLVLNVATPSGDTGAIFTRYTKALNLHAPSKIRVRRSGTTYTGGYTLDDALTVVDNIRVSPPPADVVVTGTNIENQAGNFVFYAVLSNVDTNALATNRVVTGYTRWPNLPPPANSWTNLPMTLVDAGDGKGNNERYQVTLPYQPFGGTNQFYVVSSFDGYRFQSQDYTMQGFVYPAEGRAALNTTTQTIVLAGLDLYTLTVNSGSGGGDYTNQQSVAITANAPSTGKAFDRWVGATQFVANVTSPSTVVTMPASNIAVTATYVDLSYTLTVNGGTGSGSFIYSQVVPVTADVAPLGQRFDRWTGNVASVANVTSASTTVTMPASNIVIASTYVNVYALTVNLGSGSGSYTNGEKVAVSANAPGIGKIFDRWTGDTAYLSSVTSATATVTMPGVPVTITATYTDVYALTVNLGSGSGSYTNGQRVTVIANAPGINKIFDRWTGDTAYVTDVKATNTIVTMPNGPVTITATYLDVYALTVNNGTGGGSFTNGQQVTVSANAPAVGKVFAQWTGATQYVANASSPITVVTMPNTPITITATYSNVYYSLTVNSGAGSGAYTNGQAVAVTANTIDGRTFAWWSGATQFLANALSPSTVATMPPSNIVITATYTMLTYTLPESRVLQFDDYALTNNGVPPTWVHEGTAPVGLIRVPLKPGTNHYHRTGWRLSSCRTGTAKAIGRIVPPVEAGAASTSTNLAANMQNTLGALIESPIFQEGIGTIYFEAINNLEATQITVEYATNMVSLIDELVFGPLDPAATNAFRYNWITLDVLTLNSVQPQPPAVPTDFTRYCKLLNYRKAAKIQIRRTGTIYTGGYLLDEALTVIDNIRVSAPPSDVVVKKTDCPFVPGYPSVNDTIKIRCYVDNVDMNVPTAARTVNAFYRWRYLNQASNAWANITMTLADPGDNNGNNERYEATLPLQTQVGDLEYYFVCNFDGYRYQSIDYTMSGLPGTLVGSPAVYPYASEWLSPRTLRGGASEPGGREFYTRLRPFRSQYGALYVVPSDTNSYPRPIEMMLTGNDEWRGMVPLRTQAGNVTNLSWQFVGTNAYVSGPDTYSTATVSWAEQSQVGVGRVPYGGTCVSNTSQRISVTVAGGGYVQMVFNTASLDYMTSRAEYQNFNAWPAPATNYTDSSTTEPRTRLLNTFDTWAANVDQVFNENFVSYVTSTNVYVRDPFPTPQAWIAGSAAYASERLEADYNNKPTGVVGFNNLALRLKGGDGTLGLGYVYNTVASRPDGLKQLTFKARLGQAASNFDIVYNQNEFTKSNYLVRANTRIWTPMSPEQPTVSLIGYYQNPGKFYEYRLTQGPDPQNKTSSRDQRITHQLFKWVNGTATQIGSTVTRDGLDNPLTSQISLEFGLYSTSSSSTALRCRFGSLDVITTSDNSSPISAGTFGFLTGDGYSGFTGVATHPTTTGAAAVAGTATVILNDGTDAGLFDSQALNWYAPPGRFTVTRGVSPWGIYSVIPTQKVGIYMQESDYSVTNEAGTTWQKVQEVTVPSYGYTSFTLPFYLWKAQFVKLQMEGGLEGVAVAVDELSVASWHGKQSGSGFTTDWLATEAWVVSNNVADLNVVQLEHSRANPAIDQAIRSPVLNTGMGLMEFDYRVLRAPARVTVQYALKRDASTWSNIASYVSSGTSTWTHVSAYLGNTNAGYMRVLNERVGVYTNALVEFNNAIVWDEPAVNDTSWTVYNAKVTNTDKMRVALDDSAGCFLNRSQTEEAAPIQNQNEPFVQSPQLPAGFGRITFNARAYTNNQPVTVYLYASTNGWNAPSNYWFQIASFPNISNTLYQSFSYEELYGKTYSAVKLGTKLADVKRVCLEEVAVSEPIFPGFDIVNVKVLCKDPDGSYSATRFQPLISDEVGVEAQIANKQLSPSNIQMFVTYYIGTAVWGVNNWPAGQTFTRPMFPTTENPLIYRTSPSNDIPVQELNQVVQYRVSATYMGGIPLREDQETFDAPPWYYPTDLNQTYASQGWSPYYLVYGVPVGAVWINEVNATDFLEGVGQYRYIEIAVPVGVDLAGWKVDFVTTADYTVRTIEIPAGHGLVRADAVTTNGYAFFVLAEDSNPAVPNLDYGYLGFSDMIPRIMPGGLRLRRPQGMYEQSIAYDWHVYDDSFSGPIWAANDPQHKFVYVGTENNGGSLSVTNSIGVTTNDWCFPLTWTPGLPNVGQSVPSADAVMPGVSNVVITSIMNSDKATQNDKRTTYYTLKIKKGSSTNINYVADSWYRIFSVKTNLVEALPVDSALTDYLLPLTAVQSNVTVNVTVGLREDVSDVEDNPVVLDWLLGFGDAPLVQSLYNGRELTLTELYWLNANPTVTNRLEYQVLKFEVDAVSNAHTTVRLVLNNQNVTNLQGGSVLKVEVKDSLTDPQWELLAQYSLNSASFDVNHVCSTTITNAFSYTIVGWDLRNVFSRGMIELADPRVGSPPLVNAP